MTVKLNGSGALDNLCYECADTPPPNEHPIAVDDAFCFCVDPDDLVAGDGEMWNVLNANGTPDADSDPEGDALTTSLFGDDNNDGSVTLESGAVVTLADDGSLSIDVSNAFYGGVAASDLLIGQIFTETVDYVLSDGTSTDTGTVSIEVKGATNTLETIAADIADLIANLPGPLEFQASIADAPNPDAGETGPSFSVTIQNGGDLDGVYGHAWCVNEKLSLGDGDPSTGFGVVSADVYVAGVDPLPSGVLERSELSGIEVVDLINYILNADYLSQDNGDATDANPANDDNPYSTYTAGEVQAALWLLTNNIPTNNPVIGDGLLADGLDLADAKDNAVEIALDALSSVQALGGSYEPGEGDKVGLILAPTEASDDGFVQPFVIGIPFDDLAQECLC
jgi:hypothetical protein